MKKFEKVFNSFFKDTCLIGHYNHSVRIIDLVSHTTYVVCIDCIHKWRDLQFKVGSEQQILEKQIERNLPKKYFLYFLLLPALGLEP